MHESYRHNAASNGWPLKPDLDRPFAGLSAEYQEANRAAARRIPDVLSVIGVRILPPQEATAPALSEAELGDLVQRHMKALAPAEHEGWMRVRVEAGWTLGTVRDDSRKLHPCIVPFEALSEDGVAILNADDPRVAGMATRTNANVVTYGLAPDADVRADEIESHGLSGVSFVLVHGDERVQVYSHLAGRAMVHNALAAAAAGIVEGIGLADIAAALSEVQIPTRLTAHPGINGSTIIDDTYNASPASMRAALDLLGEVKGRKIAVLGDMRELGAAEREGHTEIGRLAAEVADAIYAVGDLGRWIGDAAIQAGHQHVQIMMDKSEIAPILAPTLRKGDVVLLKASRALALETLLGELTDGASGEARR